MNLRFNTVRRIGAFFGLGALLFVQPAFLLAQPIPAEHLPPAGVDTGLEGKYGPQKMVSLE